MRWMDFLYQSSYFGVDKYYFIMMMTQGSDSIIFYMLVNPKKSFSHKPA